MLKEHPYPGTRIAALLLAAVASFAPAQTQAQAQTLKLIPVPRELRPPPNQPPASGLQITCAPPCPAEDTCASEDLKAYRATLTIPVNTASPVNILITRYGS